MAAPPILDFAALLRPIAEDNPCGPDLRADPAAGAAYQALKDARTNARNRERSGLLDEDEAGRADWRPVMDGAVRILAERSKDLEVTAWLIEALLRLHGFAGLRDGLRLARELVERFWDGLYPQPDEDGLLTRVAPLAGLNGVEAEGTLIVPLRKVPLTQGRSAGAFACWHYQQASELAQIVEAEKRQRRIAAGAVTAEQIAVAAAETDAEFFRALADDLRQCQEEFAALCAALDARCGADAPPSSQIRATLAACEEALRFIAGDALTAPPAPAPPEAAVTPANPAAAMAEAAPAVPRTFLEGQPADREEALRRLQRLAEYFRRYEPHSPLSYLLEQAVRWGRMPLPELLAELVPDEQARAALYRLTGIRWPPPPPQR
ncbi:MAG TPA: type VI secretion system protein TssA [Candidatus Competibacteraceae bacterium]|nr:type VI secretion system protein TssA [Candidatus Competibacteraceae bacterium]